MCTNFVPSARTDFLAQRLGAVTPAGRDWPAETYPGYAAPVVVRSAGGASVQLAQFGLIPPWSRDAHHARELARGTYNARSETVALKPSFRNAWAARQWALVPMECFFEPCWEDAAQQGGRATRWRIALRDGEPFAVAGLWERWTDKLSGEQADSFTLLTVNADGHPLMGRMHRPGEEKRIPVIVPPAHYADWLHASPQQAMAFMQSYPAQDMQGEPAPVLRTPKTTRPAKHPDRPAPPENLSLF
ncbi:SOS response-associated peptidase [Rhodoferax sp.]|uniref:SOS response-associated peptidase n=1 Tax=Rhodoferax sp. TaxID=50421 RepID=UPI0025D76B9D|nr:SOS response-associated peptidase [Rhodoferax sp.]